jgi:hypothetical protein
MGTQSLNWHYASHRMQYSVDFQAAATAAAAKTAQEFSASDKSDSSDGDCLLITMLSAICSVAFVLG